MWTPRGRRRLALLATLLSLSAGWVAGSAMAQPSPPTDGPAPHFPEVQGKNLEGREFNLPGDFEGEMNLVFIAFERGQQSEVDTWLPLARRLADEHPGLRYYELPTIKQLPGFIRNWIDGGMRGGIPDQGAREATITLYLDKEPFREALGITTEATITILLVDRAGALHWQTLGVWTPEKERALRALVGG